MPSSTVDQMLLQVTGAMVTTVVAVLWLWTADVRGWWPFNSRILVHELLRHHAHANLLLASIPSAGGVAAMASVAIGERIAARTARRRTRVASARVERDAAHVRSCSRWERRSPVRVGAGRRTTCAASLVRRGPERRTDRGVGMSPRPAGYAEVESGIQLPWNPNGTRRGSAMVATGLAPKSAASRITRSLTSRPPS